MVESTTSCPCCGEPIGSSGFCQQCFSVDEREAKLEATLAEIVLDKTCQKFPVDCRWVRIGRDPSNQIVLNDDRYTSRYHAWVTFDANKFWLEDLGSTNGTLLNGGQVERRELLSSGDKIRIGETDLTFVIFGESA